MYFKWIFVFKNEILKIIFKEYLLMSAKTMTLHLTVALKIDFLSTNKFA